MNPNKKCWVCQYEAIDPVYGINKQKSKQSERHKTKKHIKEHEQLKDKREKEENKILEIMGKEGVKKWK